MIPLLGGNLIPIDDLIIGGKLGGISPQKNGIIFHLTDLGFLSDGGFSSIFFWLNFSPPKIGEDFGKKKRIFFQMGWFKTTNQVWSGAR